MSRVSEVKTVDGRTLRIGEKEVRFDQRINQYFIVKDTVVALLKVDDFEKGDMLVGRNIIGFDLEGNQLWRVPDHGLRRPANPKVPDAYFGIYLDEKGKLWGATPGVDIQIDPKTGRLRNRRSNR